MASENQIYQHIQIFGSNGKYIVRPDNDPLSDKSFSSYNEALFWTIRFLTYSGLMDSS